MQLVILYKSEINCHSAYSEMHIPIYLHIFQLSGCLQYGKIITINVAQESQIQAKVLF